LYLRAFDEFLQQRQNSISALDQFRAECDWQYNRATLRIKRTVEKTVLTGFVIVLTLLGIVGVVSHRTILGLIDDSEWVNHTHVVLELLQRVSFQVTQAEAAVRGYVITGNSSFEAQYRDDNQNTWPVISELRLVTSDNPNEQKNISRLESLVKDRFAIMDEGVRSRKSGGLKAILAQSNNTRGPTLSLQISSLIGEMRTEENRLLSERNLREQKSSHRAFVVALLAVILAMAAVLGSVLLIFRDLTRGREVDRLKAEFVSIVSHELRTPLTSIHGSLGLLASGLLAESGEKGKRMLEIAVNNTDRLIRLLNDILDIEKLESGKIEMHRLPSDSGELLSRAVEVMTPMAQDHEITIHLSGSKEMIDADPDRILQCLTNLLSNAIKFSEPGGVVAVRATPTGEELRFEVADQGRGIPLDKQETIFQRFQQVDASDSRRKGGTGLGLAITRSIIQQHGGRIWVESQIGKGSTFFFTVPLAKTAGRISTSEPETTASTISTA
jgi:signal transduction histidine kinase